MSGAKDKNRMTVYLTEADMAKVEELRVHLTVGGMDPPNASQMVRAAIRAFHEKVVVSP